MRVANVIGSLRQTENELFNDIDIDYKTLTNEEKWIGYENQTKQFKKEVIIEIKEDDDIEVDSDDVSCFSTDTESLKSHHDDNESIILNKGNFLNFNFLLKK